MRYRRRALAKYALPLGVAGLAAAPALATGAPPTFAPAASYPLGFAPALSGVAVSDFNADGKPDVAVGTYSLAQFSVLPGAGSGVLGSEVVTTLSSGHDSGPVVTGDLNNDGKPDPYFAGFSSSNNIVALSQPIGGVLNFASPVAPSYWPAPASPRPASLGDLNEDGKLDVVQPGINSLSGDANTVTFRLGNGNGTFQPANPLFTNPTPGAAGKASAIADVNGDGHLDAMAALAGPGPQGSVLTALGNGNGTFQAPAPRSSTGSVSEPLAMDVADFNGDGHPDLAIANGSPTSVMLGNGDGTFHTGVLQPSLPGYGMAVGDLNGDGFDDLVLTDFYGGALDVGLGNGDGTFATVTPVPLPTGALPYAVAAADMNGDGLVDLVSGNANVTGVSVLLNTTVAPAPAVTSVAPAMGPAAGGTQVTITGTGLNGASAVTFGGTSASSFTVDSPTQITAITPPHGAGTVAVDVTTRNGTGTGAGLFTYTASHSSGGGTAPAPTPADTSRRRLTVVTPRRVVAGRPVRSTGVVPTGANRIVQSAGRAGSAAANAVFGAWNTAGPQTACPITRRNGRSTFTCTLRLAPGRWTLTTRALSGSTLVARAVTRVRVGPARVSVTG